MWERLTGLHALMVASKDQRRLAIENVDGLGWFLGENGCVCATHHIPAVIRTVARVGRLVGRQ